MEPNTPSSDISYHEYRVIVQLLRAHVDEHQIRLRAMIAFGELVTQPGAVDIDLLEIVEGWQGKRYGVFSRSAELPLRGKLRLYFLTPEEFADPMVIPEPGERRWVQDLLRRVRQGYEAILQIPPEYVQSVLERGRTVSTLTPPPSGATTVRSPLDFIRSG